MTKRLVCPHDPKGTDPDTIYCGQQRLITACGFCERGVIPGWGPPPLRYEPCPYCDGTGEARPPLH